MSVSFTGILCRKLVRANVQMRVQDRGNLVRKGLFQTKLSKEGRLID